jgi:hypothetical protein
MNRIGFKSVTRVIRSLLPLVLFLGSAAAAFAQQAPEGNNVRSADEIPQDMPVTAREFATGRRASRGRHR